MGAFWSSTVVEFLHTDPVRRLSHLTHEQALRFRSQQFQQLRAWESEISGLAAALLDMPEAADWRLLLEFPLLRLGRRIDAVLVMPNGILVLEFKDTSFGHRAAHEQTEDYALDLQDFHAASRPVPTLIEAARMLYSPPWRGGDRPGACRPA